MPEQSPTPERRAEIDRRVEPAPARRSPRPSAMSRLVGIGGRDVLIAVGALIAVIAAVRFTRPIFVNHPTVVAALTKTAPVVAKTVLAPTPADTSRLAQLVGTPQFEADRKAFAADLVKTGRVDLARADLRSPITPSASRGRQWHSTGRTFGVMLTENSRFISGAMSNVGAVGLMQVYPKVWLKALSAKFGKDLATDSTNLKYGIYILKQYIKSDSGSVTQGDVGKGLLHYNGCVSGSHTPNCKNYPSKVKSFVENQANAMCGDKSFYECIAKPFLTGLFGKQPTTQ